MTLYSINNRLSVKSMSKFKKTNRRLIYIINKQKVCNQVKKKNYIVFFFQKITY